VIDVAPVVSLRSPEWSGDRGGAVPLNHEILFALEGQASQLEPSLVIWVSCRFSVPPTVACIGIGTP
jgi:hypothetical protein